MTSTTTSKVASSPVLRWRNAPDLEAEADMGGTKGDNVYEITLVAWDEDWEIGRRDVSIRLANSNDAGKVALSHITPQVGKELTAKLTDQDGISEEIQWTWHRVSSAPSDPLLTAMLRTPIKSPALRQRNTPHQPGTPMRLPQSLLTLVSI